MNQKLVGKLLDRWGVKWDLANHGREALEKTLIHKYDIVLMDVHMPIMDGLEATRKIRSNPDNPNQESSIIALTAVALQEEKNRAYKSGIDDFIVKPFSPKVLRKVLAEYKDISVQDSF